MSDTPTNYLNTKQRRIFRGARGGFFARAGDKKVYNPVAGFRKAGGEGAVVKIAGGNSTVPPRIRPAARAARANKGVARGPREGVMQRRMNAAFAKPRKVRAVKRVPMNHGPNQGALLRKMFADSKKAAARPRRAAKRVPMNHGPNQGALQRRMNAAGVRAKNRTRRNKMLAQNPFAALMG